MYDGTFISFEGGEGAGKSTQIKLAYKLLTNCGYDVILTREPGGTFTAEKIRDLLVSNGDDMLPISQLLLIFSARYEHVNRVIIPALKNGSIVLCDRFTDSSRAYQSGAQGISLDLINKLNNLVLDGLEPDHVFFIDVNPSFSKVRVDGRQSIDDRFLNDDGFHQKVYNTFKSLSSERGFINIDGNLPIFEVYKKISQNLGIILSEDKLNDNDFIKSIFDLK